MAIGQFPQALEEVLKRAGDTREKAAKVAHVDSSTVGKVIRGTRRPTNELMKSTSGHYDDGRLYIAAAGEITDGASVPWLNNVDLHRSTVHLKVLEEIGEVEQALLHAPITKTKDQLGQKEMQQIKAAIMESIEAITALMHYVTVLCKEYSFSYFSAWREHRADLKAKKYMN